MCELLEWLIFSIYVLNGFLNFVSDFSWGFVFLNSLSMFALLCSPHIFQHYKTLFCASSQIKCAPTAWLIKLLRLNDSFIPENMDTDFPETQTCFSHKMKNVNGHSYQWNIGITIRSITIIFNKSRAGSMLFEKHRWCFIFFIIKGLGPFNFF